MRKLAVIVLGVVMFSAALSGIASAQQYPRVSNLTPFGAAADYMSLAAFALWVVVAVGLTNVIGRW